jgi:hypothetical protein
VKIRYDPRLGLKTGGSRQLNPAKADIPGNSRFCGKLHEAKEMTAELQRMIGPRLKPELSGWKPQ